GQPAFFAVVPVEAPVPVRRELLARIVAVEAEPLIEAAGLPGADAPRQERFGPLPEPIGQFHVICNEPGGVADILVHDEAGRRGDGGFFISRLLALFDPGGTLLG